MEIKWRKKQLRAAGKEIGLKYNEEASSKNADLDRQAGAQVCFGLNKNTICAPSPLLLHHQLPSLLPLHHLSPSFKSRSGPSTPASAFAPSAMNFNWVWAAGRPHVPHNTISFHSEVRPISYRKIRALPCALPNSSRERNLNMNTQWGGGGGGQPFTLGLLSGPCLEKFPA